MISRLFFALALFCASSASFAESVPASSVSGFTSGGVFGDSPQSSCSNLISAIVASGGTPLRNLPNLLPSTCYLVYDSNGSHFGDYPVSVGTGLACPSGQNWTLTGSTCSRLDCVAPQVRNASGVCEASSCQAGESVTSSVFRGWSIGPGEAGIVSSPVSSACDGQCTFSFQTVNSCTGGGGSVDAPKPIFCNYTGLKTGAQCSTSPTETGLAPTVPQHPSPCAIGEGVMTSSTGKVLCVPDGTPTSETPKIGKAESAKTNADGSKTITSTTVTCTGAGSCSSTTATTITGVGGGTGAGATPGQAGTPGTKTETKDINQKDGTADADGCDPTKQMCGSPSSGGLYTKKQETFNGPLSRFTDGLKSSVLSTSATGFFTVSIPSGSCPDWSVSVTVLGAPFGADLKPVFCSQTALNMMLVIGNVLMVVAAFGAFKVAML